MATPFRRRRFSNLQAFHNAGGVLVLSGIPFTHPVANDSAAHWTINKTAQAAWNDSGRLADKAHSGRRAMEITGQHEWSGLDSPRFVAKAGDDFSIEAWTQNVDGKAGNDFVYVRFFDADGQFITQQGPQIPTGNDWQKIEAKFKAPTGTAKWDVSTQIRTLNRVIRLDDVKVQINGAPSALANGDFETEGREWRDLGHADAPSGNGSNGIEAGSFAGPGKEQSPVEIVPGDPFHLAPLDIQWASATPQWLNQKSLPPNVKVVPALTWQGQPLSALIQFPSGAVTVWTNHPANTAGRFCRQSNFSARHHRGISGAKENCLKNLFRAA